MTTSQVTVMKSDADRDVLDRRAIGFARVRDAVYDGVYELWLQRNSDGISKRDIAAFLDRDPSWVTKALSGPGNWTLKTFGELVEALDGYVELSVVPREDLISRNYDFYADVIDSQHQTFCPVTTYTSFAKSEDGQTSVTVAASPIASLSGAVTTAPSPAVGAS